MLVYKSEIWPKNCLPHTKSDCIGFRITSDIPVVSYVSYVVQEGENTVTDGCIRKCWYISIKVDSRLKTILFPTGVATEMNFNSLFFEKFISSPNCRFREYTWRGSHKMPDQPKTTPLKVDQSGWFLTGISVYIKEWICFGLAHSRVTFRISIFGVWGPHDPLRCVMSKIS